jgi:predicted RNA-binding protein with PUA-like domain
MAYWLFKSEPESYSYADLERDGSTGWNGVRNYQARNYLRDSIQVGDGVLFYHSNADPAAVVGIAEVIEAAHADPSAFDPDSDYHDPKSKPDAPTWFQVTIKPVRSVDPPLSLARLREVPALARMELLRKGSRLSVQAVTDAEWKAVLDLAGVKPAKKTRKG